MKAPKTQKVEIIRSVRLSTGENVPVKEYGKGSVLELPYATARELIANSKAVESTKAVATVDAGKAKKGKE